MGLENYAQTELDIVMPDDGENGMNTMMKRDVLALIKVFAAQGHSGMSAPYAIGLFTKLANFQPLGPLTGKDEEWVEVAEECGKPLFQNKRRYSVFKCGDACYDIDGIVFVDPDGCAYTNSNSRIAVTFPYTPQPAKYVKVDQNGKPLELEAA